jgi:hypothetical protein
VILQGRVGDQAATVEQEPSAVEIAMLLLIVGYAWRWPRQHS